MSCYLTWLGIIIGLTVKTNGSQTSMIKVLNQVVHIRGEHACDHMTVMLRNTSDIVPVHPRIIPSEKPNLLMTGEYLAKNRNPITSFISGTITCLSSTAWANKQDYHTLAKVTKGLKFHTMFLISDKTPKVKDLKAASGPVIWIEHEKSQVYNIYKFCPKEDRKLNTLQKVWIWNNGSVIARNHDMIFQQCPGYLSNQEITLGYIYRSRTVHLDGQEINAGDHTKVFLYLAEKLKFRPRLQLLDFTNQRKGFTKFIANVNQRKITMGLGRFSLMFHNYLESLNPHFYEMFYYVSRKPRPVDTYYSLVMPFSNMVWYLIVISLISLATMFYLAYTLYSSEHVAQEGLHKFENSYLNFAIVTFCKITEPDAVPWFSKKWSTGRFLTLLWAMYCFLLVSFYNCNLRAHLSAITYEDKINTAHDVIANGQRVWIKMEMVGNIQKYLRDAGSVDVPLYQVGGLAKELDGYYSDSVHGGIPVKAVEDIIENRAVAMLSKEYVSYELQLSTTYKAALNGERLYIPREPAMSLDGNLVMRKQSPAREEVNAAIMLSVERGLVHRWITEGYPVEAFIEQKLPLVNEDTTMTMQHVAPALGFCLAGLVVGIVAFARETCRLSKIWKTPKYRKKVTLKSLNLWKNTNNGKVKLPPITQLLPAPKTTFQFQYSSY